MKRLFKFRLPKQQSAAVGAGAGLFLLSALLILFGIFYAGREVLMVGLISEIENELDVMVQLADAAACTTIGDLVDKVEAEL